MLSSGERSQNLLRMQVMASRDHYGVDRRIVNQLSFVRGAISKAEFALDMLRMRTVGRAYRDQGCIARSLHRRGKGAGGKHSSAEQAD
jgi:hypothetical protein